MIVPALNPAIYWKILYLNKSNFFIIIIIIIIIFEGILFNTGLSEGNLIYILWEILRGHTQEVININLFDIISQTNYTFFSSFISAPISTNASSCSAPKNKPAHPAEVILKPKGGAESFNPNFRSYLAGLLEGDGSIWIPVNHRDSQDKFIYPIITFSFNAKDLPLAMIIQQKLATGHIYKIKGKNAYTYRISNIVNLIKFIDIINGFMRTPKIYNLNKLIDYLNNKGYSINKYPLDNSPIDSNAWLAGLIDSDGHFSVRVSTDKNNLLKRIACSLEICQRQKDLISHSYFNILSIIGELLLCKVKETKTNSKNPQYRIRTTSLNGNLVLIDYLQKYPLFSSKYLDYKDWNLVLTYFVNKEHKIKYNEIVKIKSSMNDRRTFFTWDHLQNFYNLHN
uniref:Intronic ORF at intron 2 of nad5 n=1 Tax=Moniliophthora roreri (strain MCA 2997) TaxID=1381753 RepID=F2WVI8_MONRO|nr:intronic ORF at intron 2 of nad5 [Moniliophthora roreri]ADO51567.1 intronic ORF at intron 2 of nad5 [Moniliophthora roreri]